MLKPYFLFILPVLAMLAVGFLAFGGGRTHAEEPALHEKIYVVTTTSHLADMAENLNPGSLRIESLMGPGVDPHLFKPTSSDIAKLKDADIILYSGLHLEGKMQELLQTMAKEKPALAVGETIDQGHVLAGENSPYDPHFWMDVTLWQHGVEQVAALFKEQDPRHSAIYDAKSEDYRYKLAELDSYIRSSISSIQDKRKVLITAHDAFRYFGRAYGMNVVGIQGLSTESEAGLRHIQDLATMITDQDIPTVFTETSIPKRNVEALQEHVSHEGGRVQLGETLYSDSLGPKDQIEGTYIGMMMHNTQAIVQGLGGTMTAASTALIPVL